MRSGFQNVVLGDQRVRFIAAGSAAAGLNWVVRFPLNTVMPFALAVLCAAAIGMTAGFLLYRSFVFKAPRRPFHSQVRDFILVNVAGAAITVLTAVMLRDLLSAVAGFDLSAATHAAGIAAGAWGNYVGHRALTFPTA